MNDIDVLEKIIKEGLETGGDAGWEIFCNDYINHKFFVILNNVLKERQYDKERIKDLEEETDLLIGQNEWYKDYYDCESIPKSLIKEKIEELKKEYKIALEENSTKAFILKCQIQVLEELLKGE